VTNDELADHLARIRAASGALTPDAVVDAARDPSHALHDYFNWDDVEAADAWRRHQARHLIARVKILIPKATKNGVQEISVRGIASVISPVTSDRQYVPVVEIKQDRQLSAQVLEQIRRDLGALRRKYAAYEGLFAAAMAELVAEDVA
jgi:hypothetical protein